MMIMTNTEEQKLIYDDSEIKVKFKVVEWFEKIKSIFY